MARSTRVAVRLAAKRRSHAHGLEIGSDFLVTLPTGSVVRVLGAPERAEARFWDGPTGDVPRADAWFWSCGCAAEPAGPGRFTVEGCESHHASLQRRFERKSRTFSTYGPSARRHAG